MVMDYQPPEDFLDCPGCYYEDFGEPLPLGVEPVYCAEHVRRQPGYCDRCGRESDTDLCRWCREF